MKLEMVDTPTEEKIGTDQQRPEWRYHVTMNTAEVVIGNTLTLRPDWYGPMSPEEIRAVVRMASAAQDLYEAAKKAANELSVMLALNPARDGGLYREALDALNAAISLVDGNQETK